MRKEWERKHRNIEKAFDDSKFRSETLLTKRNQKKIVIRQRDNNLIFLFISKGKTKEFHEKTKRILSPEEPCTLLYSTLVLQPEFVITNFFSKLKFQRKRNPQILDADL